MWDLIIHPFESPAFSLAHRLVFGFDTIVTTQNPLLIDIVRFGSLRIVVNLTILKRVC